MTPTPPSPINRRDFLSRAMAGAGAGLVLAAPNVLRASSKGANDRINVALVGFGKQGEVLFTCLRNIPGLHFQAVCDISKYNLQKAVGQVRSIQKDNPPKGYMDIDDMLEKEKGLDAAIVATPDFWHSPHTIKCLEAGLHVYCEKMMAHTIEAAREMVRAMERTGKLCQIGHQRRSNPRYLFTLHELLLKHKICGQIVNINGQWNRALSSSQDINRPDPVKGYPKATIVPTDVLNRYGFKDMQQFYNWRFYRDLSGGPISDLGAHQIDVFNWFLDAKPRSVFASGGSDYFKEREHFDNVMCLFDYDTPQGGVRAFYQVLTTTSAGGGFWESFMGTEGNIKISEIAANSVIYREGGDDSTASKWDDLVRRGFLKRKAMPPPPKSDDAVAVYESAAPEAYDLPGALNKPAHQPHLENFFASVRGQAKLNCDARHAFESEAPIFWVNPSALARQPIVFTPEHLSV